MVFFQTDKSGRMTVDNKDNYRQKMVDHISCGEEVSYYRVVEIEDDLNARAKSWSMILGMGSRWNQENRVKQALTSTSSNPPPIYGLPKDHKSVTPGQEHPLRPVCGANSGPGMTMSRILALMIPPCNDAV